MKLKKLVNTAIHDKQAYRIIIEDNESFEVIRADDPELTADKGQGKKNNFYREPKPLMYFSTGEISLFNHSDDPLFASPKIRNLNGKSRSITEIRQMVKIAEKTIELHKALAGNALTEIGE
jgi:hypothetical protein